MKKILIVFLVFILSSSSVFAHQPRIVTEESKIEIEEPTISKAYYGELKGQKDIYIINSETDFDLYIGILVPDIKDIDKDVSAEIIKDKEVLDFLDGENFEWKQWFEPFAGDSYFYGPELKDPLIESVHPHGIPVQAGSYEIHISSPDNLGKYVLAVGEKESFPISEISRLIFTLPALKSDYFEKPIFLAYYNISGIFFLIVIVLITTIAMVATKIIKKHKKKSKKKKK